jgi:hypothetical protein
LDNGFIVGIVVGIVVDELFPTEETYGRGLPANYPPSVDPVEPSFFLDLTPSCGSRRSTGSIW